MDGYPFIAINLNQGGGSENSLPQGIWHPSSARKRIVCNHPYSHQVGPMIRSTSVLAFNFRGLGMSWDPTRGTHHSDTKRGSKTTFHIFSNRTSYLCAPANKHGRISIPEARCPPALSLNSNYQNNYSDKPFFGG